MANITVNNLVDLQGTPVEGQRVIQIAPGVWLPIGLGGTFAPASSSDSSSQLLAIEAGYIDENGNFQPISFEGTAASDSGSAVVGLQHKIFNTGHEEPAYPSSGDTATDFYKCTYVNSDSWGGYKAVFNGSYYQFQSDSTEGLTYSYYFVPEVGNTYAGTTCIYKVTKYNEGLPTNGLILYLPLDTTHSSADTGQPLTMTGNIMFSSIQGVPCAYFNGSSGYTLQGIDLSQLINGFTLSVWVKETKTGNSNIFGRRSEYMQAQAVFGIVDSQYWMWSADNGSDDILITQEIQNTNIRHLLYTYINGTCVIYLNNTSIASGSVSLGDNSSDTKIGLSNYSSDENFEGYIAALRLYNRVLSSAEIAALSREFTPTAS